MRLWNSFEVKALWFRIQMRTRHCVLEFGLVSFSFSFFFFVFVIDGKYSYGNHIWLF